jgi:hypothetical protein
MEYILPKIIYKREKVNKSEFLLQQIWWSGVKYTYEALRHNANKIETERRSGKRIHFALGKMKRALLP